MKIEQMNRCLTISGTDPLAKAKVLMNLAAGMGVAVDYSDMSKDDALKLRKEIHEAAWGGGTGA